ncbi:GNAT family N-acetyltransferase [Paenibacillus oenotherae]|uniref:GNAT family N-acetyltransferase n=1 Tax=Paenibacillus oenotherae TaxID=1435645 RepID=A0ABS7D3V4_9BACL|nr:GNAT family N-acetyltransferase [Paenibacillus oenotherae]MBW7474604.1 GNAT family N-acetyltransferase [Paenibacillus oenotherae]
MELSIHYAAANELQLVHGIMQQAFAEYAGLLVPPSGALLEKEENLPLLLADGKGTALLGKINDIPVASARYFVKPDFIYVGRISVLPDYRGRGIAAAILSFVEQEAARLNKREIQLEVRMSIPANIVMYEKLGYTIIEHIPYATGTDVSVTMSKPAPPLATI